MTKIFLSYSRGDDEPFVKRLYEDLSQQGFDVWFDRVSMPSRQLTFFQEIRDAIAARERLLLVIGPKARMSEYVMQEWKNALEMGKCVNAIVRLNGHRDNGGTVDGYDLMPEELKLMHAEDFRDDSRYAEHLANLIRQLSDPAPPLGKLVAVPTLPLHYLAQRDRLLKLRDVLLSDLQRPVVVTGAAARVGVQGMGGIGKSVLAAALARDLEVRRAFPDGIFWIGVGQQSNLVELQRFTARELGDEALFNDLHAGKQKLKELLAERAALLILDDVWQSTDANAFDVLGPRCKFLLTTRDAGLVSTMAGAAYQVQLPTEAEALALLANAARVPVESLPPLASEIAAECGRLPLALALCGGMASKGHLWERILRALREARLELIADRHEIEEHHRSIWRAMEVSVQVLPLDEQRRFAELAVFATDAAIPEAAVLTLWSHTGGLDELAAADLLVAFNERSLVQLDRSADAAGSVRVRVSLHDLLHDFAARLAAQLFGNLAALHNQFLDAYSKQCPNDWPTGPNDGYFFQRLHNHLIEAGRSDELASLLLDLQWLEAKAGSGLVFDLPFDFVEAQRVVHTDHPQRHFLPLIEEALRRDIHFIARHPTTLFQCLWNSCWWYDCQEAARHYDPSQGPLDNPRQKLCDLLRVWRIKKEQATPGFRWTRSPRPPTVQLSTAQKAVLRGHVDAVTSVGYSPDGHRIISGSADRTVRVWDAATGAELLCLRGHKASINSVAISPDGRRIVSGSSDQTLRIWDAVDGSVIRCLDLSDYARSRLLGDVQCVAYSPDGLLIATAVDVTVQLWDANSGAEVGCLRGHEYGAHCVTFSPDGSRVASGDYDGNLRVWDVITGTQTYCVHGHVACVETVAFSPDGRRLASGSWDATVRLWDASSGAGLHDLYGHKYSIKSVAFSPDGQRIVSGSFDDTVRVWDTANGDELCCFGGHDGRVNSVAFSPDGQRLISGSSDKTIRVWDTACGSDLGRLRGHEAEVNVVAFSPDGQFLASGANDATVRLWNGVTGTELRCLRGHQGIFVHLAFSHDGRRLASAAANDNTVRVWDIASGVELYCLRGHKSWANCVAFSPDGSRLASGAHDDTVRVWDVASGTELHCLHGLMDVLSLAFSPDGKRLVAGEAYWTIMVWDVDSGAELHSLSFYHGRAARVNCVAFSHDGRWIISGSGDNTVRVWDADSAAEILCLSGHKGPVMSVAFSSDCRKIFSSSLDNSMRVWDVSGNCIEVIRGIGDLAAIAAGAPQFPWRALSRGWETVIESAASGEAVSWFPVAIEHITTHPSGRKWAGAVGNYVCLITLEGGEEDAAGKCDCDCREM